MSKKLLILPAMVMAIFLTGCTSSGDNSLLSVENSGKIQPLEDLSFDWEDINIEGGNVDYVFRFRNTGDDDLILKSASTTCMCTTATIELEDGTTSPEFGMHANTDWGVSVAPEEEFEVKVVFDPMAHGPNGTGPITRSVFLETSSVSNGDYADSDSRTGAMTTEMKLEGNVLSKSAYQLKMESDLSEEGEADVSYENVSAEDFKQMLEDKDFFLLDVHIPEQEHIEGTDAFISYDAIADNLSDLPQDKSEKIVVYCRSGSMSLEASQELIDLGYTNVVNLQGGRNAYVELSN